MITVQAMNYDNLVNLKNKLINEKQWFTQLFYVTPNGDEFRIETLELSLDEVVTELMKKCFDKGFTFAVESRLNDYQKRMLRVAYEMGKRGEPVGSIEQLTKINNF